MRYDERPTDHTPVHTAQLPDTPVRDLNIPASAWLEAPAELLGLGSDLLEHRSPTTSAGSGRGCCGGRSGDRRRCQVLGVDEAT